MELTKQFTVSMVFLSITKMPSTLNPIGAPFIRLKNTLTYATYYQKEELPIDTANEIMSVPILPENFCKTVLSKISLQIE